MPIIADFKIVTSETFTLPNDDDGVNKELSFELANDTITAKSGPLFWVVESARGQPTYRITLNGTELFAGRVVDSEQRTMHALKATVRIGTNTLVVERTSNSGSVTIDDMVVYFRRRI